LLGGEGDETLHDAVVVVAVPEPERPGIRTDALTNRARLEDDFENALHFGFRTRLRKEDAKGLAAATLDNRNDFGQTIGGLTTNDVGYVDVVSDRRNVPDLE